MKNIAEEQICRGKRKDNGKWIVGYLLATKENVYICPMGQYDDDILSSPKNVFFQVFPETVGRYTGLHDATKWEELSEEEKVNFFAEIVGEKKLKEVNEAEEYWKGKRIFEDDIVLTQPFSDRPYSKKARFKQHKGVVKHYIRHFKNSCHEQDFESEWTVSIKDIGNYGCYNWSTFFECKVIGNAHDTPELIENEKKEEKQQ